MRFLGVDGGGTKTVAWIADERGDVRSRVRGGATNWEVVGIEGARNELSRIVGEALSACGSSVDDITAAAFGMAGADRERERAIVEGIVARALPIARRFVENDSLLVLRALSPRAIGVGLVAGTGTNCIARDATGRRHQIGGMGAISGDAGSASDVALRAIAATWMASERRGPETALERSLPAALGILEIQQACDLFEGGGLPESSVRAAVACFFSELARGDEVARAIHDEVAVRLASTAVAALDALDLHGADALVALGGSMFQSAGCERLAAAVHARVVASRPDARVALLDVDPVVGALLFAHDLVGPVSSDFDVAIRRPRDS